MSHIYFLIPDLDLYVAVASGEGQISGITINGEVLPAGVNERNLGLAKQFLSDPARRLLSVVAQVLKPAGGSSAASLSVRLFQRKPRMPETPGVPVTPGRRFHEKVFVSQRDFGAQQQVLIAETVVFV